MPGPIWWLVHRGKLILGGAVLSLVLPGGLTAQDVQPRVYTPAPVGVNLFTLGYAFSTGPVLFDKTIPIEEADAKIHSLTAAYSRSLGLFGRSARADVALPLVTGDWEGNVERVPLTASRTGLGDPVLRLVVALAGAPALSREEFAQFEPKTIIGLTLRLRAPIGQYDPQKFVNLGSNRWVFSPQIGVSHVAGRIQIEAYASAWLFTDNDEFLGSRTLIQEPLYAFQVHIGYEFRRGLWVAASTRQSFGGASSVDGGDRIAPESNNRVGLTLAVPITGRHALRAAATTGVTTTVGNDYTTLSIGWQLAF